MCLVLLLPVRAVADSTAYQQLVQAAIAAQEAGHYAEARELFAQAHALDPNARSLRGMGVSGFQAGDYVQAIADLEASLVNPVRPLDLELKESVAVLLLRARAFVGTYTLEVNPVDTVVSVDNRPAVQKGALVLEPGEHSLVFAAPGFVSQQVQVNVHAGAREVVQVALVPEASRQTPALATEGVLDMEPRSAAPFAARLSSAETGKFSTETARMSARSRRATWGLLGVGAAFAAASATMALIGLKRVKPINAACDDGCTEAYRERALADAHVAALERAVNVTGGTALAALAASLGTWTWQRYVLAARGGATQKSVLLTTWLRF